MLDDPFSLLLPDGHPLADADEIDLADLAREPWIDTASAPGHCQAAALEACRAAGFTPAYAVEADEYPTTAGFVSAGLGVALVPALALSFANPRVCVKAIRGAQPARHVYAAARTSRTAEPVLQEALRALVEAAASVPGALPRRPARAAGWP